MLRFRIPSTLSTGHLQHHGTVPTCIKVFFPNIQFSLLRAISGSRDTACDQQLVQGSGINSMSVSKQCGMEIGGQIPPSVLLGSFEVCLIQFLPMGLSPIGFTATELYLWLEPSFPSLISSPIIVLPGIISQVT